MADFKIDGPGGIRSAGGVKGAKKTATAGGPSFAQMVDEAGAVDAPEAAAPMAPYTPYAPLPQDPMTGRRQASTLLESLTTLADDALAGNPTRALADLQAALQQSPIDRNELNGEQRQALDELATRAAVEVAKRGV